MKHSLSGAKVVAALAIACLLYTVVGRLFYDCDLEWMGGSMLDHIERVRAGLPIYTKPTWEWTPFLYPPLYYEITARVANVMPLFIAARVVALAGTAVQAACVWRIAAKHGADRTWCFIAVGMFAGAFADESFWYDLERVDTLFVALMALGVVVLTERASLLATAGAGVVMGLGFFAKQPALLFLCAAAAALALTKQHARSAVFSLSAGVVIIAGVAWYQARTDGWFAYYVLGMPGKHGVLWSLFKVLFLEDIPRAGVLVGSAVFLVAMWVRAWRRGEGKPSAILVSALVAGAFSSGTSRAHFGGWDNVLMFFITFGCAAVAIVGTKLSARWASSRAGFLVPAAAAFQIIIWAYDPTSAVPPRYVIRDARRLESKIAELEKDGEVLVTGRGHVTKPRHAHEAAIVDVLRTENRVPEEIAAPFRERRFAAIVLDALEDLTLPFLPPKTGRMWELVMPYYFVAERLPSDLHDTPVGFHTHPKLVLKPRKEPVDPSAVRLIRCLVDAEVTIAQNVERNERDGAKLPVPADVEGIAREMCKATLEGIPLTGPK